MSGPMEGGSPHRQHVTSYHIPPRRPSMAVADVETIVLTVHADEAAARAAADRCRAGGYIVEDLAPPVGTTVAEVRRPVTMELVGEIRFREPR